MEWRLEAGAWQRRALRRGSRRGAAVRRRRQRCAEAACGAPVLAARAEGLAAAVDAGVQHSQQDLALAWHWHRTLLDQGHLSQPPGQGGGGSGPRPGAGSLLHIPHTHTRTPTATHVHAHTHHTHTHTTTTTTTPPSSDLSEAAPGAGRHQAPGDGRQPVLMERRCRGLGGCLRRVRGRLRRGTWRRRRERAAPAEVAALQM